MKKSVVKPIIMKQLSKDFEVTVDCGETAKGYMNNREDENNREERYIYFENGFQTRYMNATNAATAANKTLKTCKTMLC